jgi:hypothetical protein
MPPAYKAEVVQARLKRRTVVLTAVCALGGIVFALAAVRGIQRHLSPDAPSHPAIATTTALQTSARSPSTIQSTAPSAAVAPREPMHAPTGAERAATASTAKQTGIAASPPRAIPTSKRAPSKATFDPAAL